MKKTLIIGVTENPDRYAFKAAERLVENSHPIINIGIKSGVVAGQPIQTPNEIFQDIDTITLYVGPQLQKEYYDYILKTKPKRIIFNPGTENPELAAMAASTGIQAIQACTLVLLATQQY
jgi:predicted CoA-binding protein